MLGYFFDDKRAVCLLNGIIQKSVLPFKRQRKKVEVMKYFLTN